MLTSFVTVKEAISLIHENICPLENENVLLADSAGRIIKQRLLTDRPLPPFDRVMMDGFAINSNAWLAGVHKYFVTGKQMAGSIGATINSQDECVEVATGAPLPAETDSVVPIEWTSMVDGKIVIKPPAGTLVQSGQFVHRKGSDHSVNETLVDPGTILNPGEVAIAATCGYTELTVTRLPVVSILGTGDELVPVESTPTPFQIRESNVHALSSACLLEGIRLPVIDQVPDDQDMIRNALKRLDRGADLLIFTGGISVGRKDYLSEVLADCGFETIFHGVRQTPGKPLWFGKKPDGPIAFGLPGNPISAVVGFVRYVRLALKLLQGIKTNDPVTVELKESIENSHSFTRFLPVCLEEKTSGAMRVQIKQPNNSGDLAALVGTDGFIELPHGKKNFCKGYPAAFFPWQSRGN